MVKKDMRGDTVLAGLSDKNCKIVGWLLSYNWSLALCVVNSATVPKGGIPPF